MPRFLADEMLGSLARWLRLIGQDTLYIKGEEDGRLASIAGAEGRILLTRDRLLAASTPHSMLIRSTDLMEQLRQVLKTTDLDVDESATRCTRCNGELLRVDKGSVEDEVPEGSLRTYDEFFRCTECGAVYWKGSHWLDIRRRLDSIMSDRSSP